MSKHAKPTFDCPVCGEHRPAHDRFEGEMVRPNLVVELERSHPAWTPALPVCKTCLNDARARYVASIIEEEKGELSRAEKDVVESFRASELLATNSDAEFDQQLEFGDRMSDRIASFGGSWTFILAFGGTIFVWIILNTIAWLYRPFDPYPYILLNLVLSCVAAIQAPVIMMSQKRQEAKDRLRATNDYRVNLKAEIEIRHLNEKFDLLLSRQWQHLLEIQRVQVDMMEQLVERQPRKALPEPSEQ